MNENPSFEQIEIVNIVNNFIIALITSTVAFILLVVFGLVPAYCNARLAPVSIAMFIPLYYSVVSMIANQISIRLVGMRQTIETTNYNIGNG
ncbi:hypothetical protein ACWYRQ_18520 [Clostridioides difficile]